MAHLDIAEVARRSGARASTLRYYEERGLIASVGRRGLRRLFDPGVLRRLEVIAAARACGLSLDEIARLLAGDALAMDATADEFDKIIHRLAEMRDDLRRSSGAASGQAQGAAATPRRKAGAEGPQAAAANRALARLLGAGGRPAPGAPQPPPVRPINHLDARLPYGTSHSMETERLVSTGETPWRPLEDRHKDRDAKRRALLSAAMRLFLEKGWRRATMQHLAERLNITKPALYTYFASKEEILRACILQNAETTADAFAIAEAAPGTGLDRLRAFVTQYAIVSCTEGGAFVHRIDDRELQADLFAEFLEIKRAIDRRARALIEDGVADGSIAPCDVRMAAFAMMGSVQSISSWYRPDGPLSSDEIAEQFAKRLVEGLIRPPPPPEH